MSHQVNRRMFCKYQNRCYIVLFMILIFQSMCSSASEANDLIGKLELMGLSKNNIKKIVLVGDESSFTSGVSVILTNRYIIEKICNTFGKKIDGKSKVYSGYRRIRLYSSEKSNNLDLMLFLNNKSEVKIKDENLYYNCQGLHEYIERLMEPFRLETKLMWKEIEEKQKGSKQN